MPNTTHASVYQAAALSRLGTSEVLPESEFRDFTSAQRKKEAKKGHALPDGSFPINSVEDLKNAIQAYGRAKDKAAAKKHIIKRAKALGETKLLPEDWDAVTADAALVEEETVPAPPAKDDAYWAGPHPYEDNPEQPDDACMCSLPADDPIHVVEEAILNLEEDVAEEIVAPHTYEDNGQGLCGVCGLPAEDPLHAVVAVEEPMQFSAHGWDDPEDGTTACVACGEEVLAAIHDNEVPITAGAEDAKGARFRIPVLIPGNATETGDGRSFAANSLTVRDLPIALRWQVMSSQGHDQSVVVGRIDHVEMLEDGGIGNVTGVFDTGKYALEAVRQLRAGMLRGVSADLDKFDAGVLSNPDPDRITAQKIQVDEARLSGATLVAISAFSEAYIELVDEDPAMPDGDYIEETEETLAASLVAAGIPVDPPEAWFKNPGLSKPTHLTITDEGRVFGHIAAWSTHHIGLPYGTRPPRSASNYAYFRTGSLRTAEGTDVRVGQISLSGGHAPLSADARKAVEHYDNTNSAMCDLAAGEDSHGIWVSGALRPGITPEKLRAFRASSPSGDWRPINGKLELVAVCSVNVPGFPVAQARVASGAVVALVAAGMTPLLEARKEEQYPHVQPDEKALVAAVLAQIELENKAKAAVERLAPVKAQKQAALTAAAQTAAEKVAARKAELSLQAEEVVARVASLRYRPPFEEAKHPRDEEGKFRRVLARLQKVLDTKEGGPTAEDSAAVESLEKAATAEESGDNKTAAAEADKAAAAAPEIASEVKEAKARLDAPAGEDEDEDEASSFDKLSAEAQRLLEEIALREDDVRVKKYIKGVAPLSVEEIADIIEHYLETLLLPRFR